MSGSKFVYVTYIDRAEKVYLKQLKSEKSGREFAHDSAEYVSTLWLAV